MNNSVSFIKRLAYMLITVAVRILPSSRSNWARAMLSEFYYQDRDDLALSWAMGCLIACIKMRYATMLIGNLKVSRWILTPELLFCFLPLSMLWLGFTFQMLKVLLGNMEFIHQYFFGVPGGTAILVMLLSSACLGISGPVGLFVAFRFILFNRTLHRGTLGKIMITSPLVLGIINMSVWKFIGAILPNDYWAALLLFYILPALGAAHLYYFYSSKQPETIANQSCQ